MSKNSLLWHQCCIPHPKRATACNYEQSIFEFLRASALYGTTTTCVNQKYKFKPESQTTAEPRCDRWNQPLQSERFTEGKQTDEGDFTGVTSRIHSSAVKTSEAKRMMQRKELVLEGRGVRRGNVWDYIPKQKLIIHIIHYTTLTELYQITRHKLIKHFS